MKNQKTYETAQVIEVGNERDQRVDRNVHALMMLAKTIENLASRLSVGGTENLTDDEKRIVRIAMLPAINEMLHQVKIQYVSGAELNDVMVELENGLKQL